jgi:hypothetical protein
MTISSSNKLTKYTTGTVIVSDVANSWFGGLYGSFEGSFLDSSDPRVFGHIHDGEKADGHASKINLVNHVVGKLQNAHLGDEAVHKRNVGSFLSQTPAIPEYEVIGGNTYYYLNLSSVYSYVDDSILQTPFETASTSPPPADDVIRQKDTDYSTASGLDFLIGSSKLDDINSGTDGDHRFFFDKSKAAFRAGSANSTQWDHSNRGANSSAFGNNNLVAASAGFASGLNNTIDPSGSHSMSGGESNTVSSENSISVGNGNSILLNANNSAVFGRNNSVESINSLVYGSFAKSTVAGEFSHASGRFSTNGDAQTTEYVVRGEISAMGAGTVYLHIDGSSTNMQMEANAAYNISVSLIGKRASPSQHIAAYRLESAGVGPIVSPPASSAISSPLITVIGAATYFSWITVNLSVVSDEIRVSVSDPTLVLFQPTYWVATVKLTKCMV